MNLEAANIHWADVYKDIARVPEGFRNDSNGKPIPEGTICWVTAGDRTALLSKEGTSFGRLLGMLLQALTPQLAAATTMFEQLNARLNVIKHADGTSTDDRFAAVRLIESTVQTYVRDNFPAVTLFRSLSAIRLLIA